MLARYFLRAALIVAAVLSMVSPAAAGWSGTVYGYATACQPSPGIAVSGATWDQMVINGFNQCGGSNPQYRFLESGAPGSWGSTYGSYDSGYKYTFYAILNCTSPQVPSADGLSCVEAPPPPPSECTVYPVSRYLAVIGGSGDQPAQACVSNCLINTGSGVSWGVAPDREWQSDGRSTGAYCAGNTAGKYDAADTSCPAGQWHDASGACVPLPVCPYNAALYAVDVNCHAPLCATDVSLYASDSRCLPDPNSSASAVPAVVDCAVTPDAPACVGAVSGVAPIVTGTPGTSGVYAAPTYGGGGSSGVGDSLTFDAVADTVPLGDKSVAVGTIQPVLVGGSAGTCPAPSAMVLHGQTYYFDWTTYCNFAAWIKPLLLAFSWLAAAGILVGGFVA